MAEQVTRSSDLFPLSAPKSPFEYMRPFVGKTSILLAEGEEWKVLRKKFNPGFAPQHLNTLIPSILTEIPAFISRLDALAESGEKFEATSVIIDLIFSVMGSVVMGVDIQAQSGRGELIRIFLELLECYNDDKADLPWWIIPRLTMKRKRLGKQLDILLQRLVYLKYDEVKQDTSNSRSILSLSLQDVKTLTPEVVAMTSDHVKTFFFAGHDTTSTTLSWALYELSPTPRALEAVRAELDEIFGAETDTEALFARLMTPEGPDLVRRMTYILAVIKKTLRLHPPGGTGRMTPPGTGFTLRTPAGEEFCADNLIIFSSHSRIHRDRSVYGDTADDFMPERWLSSEDGSHQDIPVGAWRPFERGPRNCIGQDFALIEARIVIAFVSRHYHFTKVGLGEIDISRGTPRLGLNGQYETSSKLYQTRQVTAKPVDGMKMTVQRIGPTQ